MQPGSIHIIVIIISPPPPIMLYFDLAERLRFCNIAFANWFSCYLTDYIVSKVNWKKLKLKVCYTTIPISNNEAELKIV